MGCLILIVSIRTQENPSEYKGLNSIPFKLHLEKSIHILMIEQISSIGCKLKCAPMEDSDQPVHSHSLIIVLNGRSMGSHWSNVSAGGKLRLCSYCAVAQTGLNFRCTHMRICTLS